MSLITCPHRETCNSCSSCCLRTLAVVVLFSKLAGRCFHATSCYNFRTLRFQSALTSLCPWRAVKLYSRQAGIIRLVPWKHDQGRSKGPVAAAVTYFLEFFFLLFIAVRRCIFSFSPTTGASFRYRILCAAVRRFPQKLSGIFKGKASFSPT